MGHSTRHAEPRSPASRQRLLAAALLFLALGLAWRAVVCFVVVPAWETHNNIAPAPDHYPDLAEALLDRGTLGYGSAGAEPTTLRGPAFPAWLAGGMLLGGRDPAWLGFWASLPGVIVAAVIGLLLWRSRGPIASIIGWGIAALHPLPAFVSGRVMSDEFFGALGFAGAALWIAALSARRPSTTALLSLAAGATLAGHLLCRSNGLLTILVLLAVTAATVRPLPWQRVLPILVIVALPAAGWSVRSSRLAHQPLLVHASLAGFNFWLGERQFENGPPTVRGKSHTSDRLAILKQAGMTPADPSRFWCGDLTPSEVTTLEHRLRQAAFSNLRNHPWHYASRFTNGLWRYWFAATTVNRQTEYFLVIAPILLLALLGIYTQLRRCPRLRDPLFLVAVLTIILNMLAYAAICPMARYSVQIYPFLAYLAGIGAARLGFRRSWSQHTDMRPLPTDLSRPGSRMQPRLDSREPTPEPSTSEP